MTKIQICLCIFDFVCCVSENSSISAKNGHFCPNQYIDDPRKSIPCRDTTIFSQVEKNQINSLLWIFTSITIINCGKGFKNTLFLSIIRFYLPSSRKGSVSLFSILKYTLNEIGSL